MELTWTVVDAVRPFTKGETRDIMYASFAAWEKVCGLRTKYISKPEQANVRILHRALDGRGGVLAEAQLPCGNVGPQTRLWARFDSHEEWVVAKETMGISMDLLRVATHEFGHSCGLEHAPQGSRNLMAPTVSSIRVPQSWEITRMVNRYGTPSQTPEPDVVVLSRVIQEGDAIYQEIDGQRYRLN